MITREILIGLAEIKQVPPRGWYRWLHDHYEGAYQECRLGLATNDYDTLTLKDDPVPIYLNLDAPELWVNLFNHQAWWLGTAPLFKTYQHFFDDLAPLARGSFMASAIEVFSSEELADFFVNHHRQMIFSPDTFCQIACVAIKRSLSNKCWQHVCDALMGSKQDLTSEIQRCHYTPPGIVQDPDPLNQLSGKVIDVILEAAIFCNSPDNTKRALERGANPNISIWQLERSCNEWHNALSYAVSNGYNEIVDILLTSGANDKGTSFFSDNKSLFHAAYRSQDDLVSTLVSAGSMFGPLDNPTTDRRRFVHKTDEILLVKETIGIIVPLSNISEKQAFSVPHPYGGFHHTFLQLVLNDVERLKRYEELGLDVRLTPEEICSAISRESFDGLDYLFSKHGEAARQQAMSAIEAIRE